MRRFAMMIALICAIGAVLGTGYSVQAASKHETLSGKYQRAYWSCVRHFHGRGPCGRNIVNRGVKYRHRPARPATKHEKARSTRQLRRLVRPESMPVPPDQRPAGVATASPLGGLAACIRAHEGGYTSVDPSGTYYGAYQFDDATWKAATGLSGHASAYSPSTQDAAFARWWPGHHSAWPRSGPACGG